MVESNISLAIDLDFYTMRGAHIKVQALSIAVQVKCGMFVYQTFTFDQGHDNKMVGFPS